jgi:hypothetical protein
VAKTKAPTFTKESDLCSAFIKSATRDGAWTAYNESGGFDVLMVRVSDGVQVGIQAKLRLNAKVVCQIIPSTWRGYGSGDTGPDYRAILIPDTASTVLRSVCSALGVTIIRQRFPHGSFAPGLPGHRFAEFWHEWLPSYRCKLPDYVPDVDAGRAAPVALTSWKIKAIKIAILLERRPITRWDFKVLGISPSRWTDPYTEWLKPTPAGYVAGKNLPDFKGQHPRNWAEIEADFDKWAPPDTRPAPTQGVLV